MPEIGFLLRSSKLSIKDLVFAVSAVNIQMARDFAPAYGIEPWPCSAYAELPAKGAFPIAVIDEIDDPNVLGDHTGVAGLLVFGRVLACDRTPDIASHEACEMRADPMVNRWIKLPDGRDVAYEACDPVEQDLYQIQVDVLGERRMVNVSNFVLPSWYQADAPPPYDFLGKLTAPFSLSPGGYMITRDDDGFQSQSFAHTATREYRASVAAKALDPMSRTARRGKGMRGFLRDF